VPLRKKERKKRRVPIHHIAKRLVIPPYSIRGGDWNSLLYPRGKLAGGTGWVAVLFLD